MKNEVKEPAPTHNYISPEHYLQMERAAEERHEYFQGKIFPMPNPSIQHHNILRNLYTLLTLLKGKNCKLYGGSLRIHVPENTLYTYADMSIICSNPETTDHVLDTVVNPSVIIEILSKATKDYDRGTKFSLYRNIKTLKEYILIDSTSIVVETWQKKNDNSWVLNEFKQLTDSFVIATINLKLNLQDIYDDVSWNE